MKIVWALCALAVFGVVGCDNSPDSNKGELGEDDRVVPLYSIGGSVTGLVGSGLVLRLNNAFDVAVPPGNVFDTGQVFEDGADYFVAVGRQPVFPAQLCSVNNPSGVIAGADVENVQVDCVVAQFPVSVTVVGLQGAGLAVQLLTVGGAAQTVAVAADGVHSFAQPLFDLTQFSLSVTQQPSEPAQVCEVQSATLVVNGGPNNGVVVECFTEVQPAFDAGANWNDYVEAGGPLLELPRGVQACDAVNSGRCVNGGVVRELVLGPGVTSCDGLSADDALGAFDWECDERDGRVRVVSRGLRAGVGLTQLIEPALLRFKENRVLVSDAAGLVEQSALTEWWSNPIVSGGAALDTAGTIYLLETNGRRVVSADRVSVLALPDQGIKPDANVTELVHANNRQYLWFEGRFVGLAGDPPVAASRGLAFDGSRFVVGRRLVLDNIDGDALAFANGRALTLDEYRSHLADVGLHVEASAELVVRDAVVVSSVLQAMLLDEVADVQLHGVQLVDDGSGIELVKVPNAVVDRLRANNLRGAGVRLDESPAARLSRLQCTHMNGACVRVATANLSTRVVGMTAYALPFGVQVTAAPNETTVEQSAVGRAAQALFEWPANTTLILRDVTVDAALALGGGAIEGVAELETEAALAGSFIGKVVTTDATNPRNSLGLQQVASLSMSSLGLGWTEFDNALRGWGPESDTTVQASLRQACTSECRIYDWTLSSAANPLRDQIIGDMTTYLALEWPHATSISACGEVTGAAFNEGVCESVALRHAVEVSFDEVGNDDGLCTSGERCYWFANLGADQGAPPAVVVAP